MNNRPDEILITEVDGIVLLHLRGEIDLSTRTLFKNSLNLQIAKGYTHILVDLENVTFMDSSGFGTLLSAMKLLKPLGGTIALANCNGSILRMLEITRLDSIFSIYSNSEDGLRAIKNVMQQQSSK